MNKNVYADWCSNKSFYSEILNKFIFVVEEDGIICSVCSFMYAKKNKNSYLKKIPFVTSPARPSRIICLSNHIRSSAHHSANANFTKNIFDENVNLNLKHKKNSKKQQIIYAKKTNVKKQNEEDIQKNLFENIVMKKIAIIYDCIKLNLSNNNNVIIQKIINEVESNGVLKCFGHNSKTSLKTFISVLYNTYKENLIKSIKNVIFICKNVLFKCFK
jgi:hypothetical protein